MEPKKQIEIIEEKCIEKGLNIREVFRSANVPEATISNWRRKEPDAFETLNKVNAKIDEMTTEKLNPAE